MIHSIIKDKKIIIRIAVIAFWLVAWQLICSAISQEILLVSPVSVVKTLFMLIQTSSFWTSLWFSFSKIALGFFSAFFTGTVLAVLSYKYVIIRELLSPVFITIKAIPVASFVILALVWINSRNLSVLISFLMVIPVIYTNLLEGLNNTDKKLLEMCSIFKVTLLKKIMYIYLPAAMPFIVSACSLSLGLCWKSGIAAEVIGLPNPSIGLSLYQSKIFFNTNELFAWTTVIVFISFSFEKVIMFFIKKIERTVLSYEYRDKKAK